MPEIAVDEDLIHRLPDEQFPDLAGLAVRKVARGWDNELWRLGEDLAVRIPMLERAPEMLRKEYQWVPGLALPCRCPSRSRCAWDREPTWIHADLHPLTS